MPELERMLALGHVIDVVFTRTTVSVMYERDGQRRVMSARPEGSETLIDGLNAIYEEIHNHDQQHTQ